MTTLPASIDFTGSAVTEAQFKTAITNLISYLTGLLGTAGTQGPALIALGALAGQTVSKTSAYTVVSTDRGKIFLCSGTFTLTFSGASVLGNGFSCIVINIGSGVITIDPNSTETINGAATKGIVAGSGAIVSCNGTALYSMGDYLPAATASVLGGVKIGARISVASGVISADVQAQNVAAHAAGSYSMLPGSATIGMIAVNYTNQATELEVAEWKIARAGTIRVRIGCKTDGSMDATSSIRVLKNDVSVYLLTNTTTAYTYYNADIAVGAADTIQIKILCDNSNNNCVGSFWAAPLTDNPADVGTLYTYIDP